MFIILLNKDIGTILAKHALCIKFLLLLFWVIVVFELVLFIVSRISVT